MSDILVTSPFQPFTLPTQFKAVFNGYIYCGTVDAVDPSVSQVQVYLVNEAGDKVPVAQPLRTNAGGYLVYNGQPAKFVTDSNHSLLAQDSLGAQVWYEPNMGNIDPQSAIKFIFEELASHEDGKGDALIAVKQPFPNAIFQTQHEFNVPIRNVFSWGVVANGVFTGDADAMQACLYDLKAAYPAGAAVYMPPGEYRFNKTIIIPDRINIFGDGAGTQIRPIGALLGAPTASIFRFDYGPSTNGAFMRDLTITGDDIVKGIDTTLQPTDAVIRQVYALNFSGITVQNCAVGYEMQGWWHSSMRDCRAGGCNVGLRLLGQCVSIHIDACKFSSKGLAQPTSIGIDVRPAAYTWSGGNTVCSESIIIDGETMCIGVNVGIWAVESLHMHIDKVTLDFIGAAGLILERNNATFSMQNTWIAAQADSTKQFVGVDLRGQSPAVQRTFSGLEIRCNNANPLNNNIGISLGNSVTNVNIKKSSISGGAQSVYGKLSRVITITENSFDQVVYLDNVDFLDMSNNYMSNGLTLLNSPVTSSLNMGFNGNVSTRGFINVPISGGGTTGSIGIPSPVPGVVYGVKTICVDSATGKDTASISGTTITVNRPTPVGPAVSSLVEYFIVGN